MTKEEEEPKTISLSEEVAQAFFQNPKLLETLKKRAELDTFKGKYHAIRATPLKCPACSQWQQSGGSLWSTEEKGRFVCRKCKLEWKVECLTKDTEELIVEMRQIIKEA